MNSRVKFIVPAMLLFWVKMAFAGQLGVVTEGSIVIPERPTFVFPSGSGSASSAGDTGAVPGPADTTNSAGDTGATPGPADTTNAELDVNVSSSSEINNESASSGNEPIQASSEAADGEIENSTYVALESTSEQSLLVDVHNRIEYLNQDRAKNPEFQNDYVENVTLNFLQRAQLRVTFEDGELTAALTDINKNAAVVSTRQNLSVERMTPAQVEHVLSLIDIILKDTSLTMVELRNVVSLQNYIQSAR